MAYDEGVAQRVREALAGRHDLGERRMFGGLAFMLRGHMVLGVVKDALMARVGADGYAAALAQPHARAMDFTGRPMTGFVYVEPAGFETDAALQAWVERCATFVATLAPKPPVPATTPRAKAARSAVPLPTKTTKRSPR